MVKITHARVKIITDSSDGEYVCIPLSYTDEEVHRFLTEKRCTGCYFVYGYDPESESAIPVVGFFPYHETISVAKIVNAVDAVRNQYRDPNKL